MRRFLGQGRILFYLGQNGHVGEFRLPSLVAIETRDGRRGEFLQPTRKGDPDMPLSDRELEEKFLELATPVLGEAAARALVARLWTLERSPRV